MAAVVAALFIEGPPRGVYQGLPDVDPWDERRDARLYAGPYPVIAHPPCARWGSYWYGGPSAKVRRKLGDDDGCFVAALTAVRKWGGVLEHPEASSAWRTFLILAPPRGGGWIVADWQGGWTCCVEQGHYGHRARKATWLYVNGIAPPPLRWGRSAARVRIDLGYHSTEERRRAMHPPKGLRGVDRTARREWLARYAEQTGKEYCCPKQMGARERAATPAPFRDLLLAMARMVPANRAGVVLRTHEPRHD